MFTNSKYKMKFGFKIKDDIAATTLIFVAKS